MTTCGQCAHFHPFDPQPKGLEGVITGLCFAHPPSFHMYPVEENLQIIDAKGRRQMTMQPMWLRPEVMDKTRACGEILFPGSIFDRVVAQIDMEKSVTHSIKQ